MLHSFSLNTIHLFIGNEYFVMRKDGFVLFVAAIPKGEYIDFELERETPRRPPKIELKDYALNPKGISFQNTTHITQLT